MQSCIKNNGLLKDMPHRRRNGNKMEKKKIDRINELGRLSRVRELTDAEKEEQRLLREEYIKEFRSALRGNKS